MSQDFVDLSGLDAAIERAGGEMERLRDALQRMEGRAIAAEAQALALAEQMLKIEKFYEDAIKGARITRAGCPDQPTKDLANLAINNYTRRQEMHLGADSHFANMARSIVQAAKERKR